MRQYKVSDLQTWNKTQNEVSNVPGVYELRVLERKGINFRPLQRRMSVDQNGILYIGASLSLPARVASLRKGVLSAYGREYKAFSAHLCGTKLHDRPRINEFCDVDSLCIMVETCGNSPEDFEEHDGHYELEWLCLQRYCDKCGEYPPLNG
jgi:hypothetical protein